MEEVKPKVCLPALPLSLISCSCPPPIGQSAHLPERWTAVVLCGSRVFTWARLQPPETSPWWDTHTRAHTRAHTHVHTHENGLRFRRHHTTESEKQGSKLKEKVSVVCVCVCVCVCMCVFVNDCRGLCLVILNKHLAPCVGLFCPRSYPHI